jgi:hypothetical protein
MKHTRFAKLKFAHDFDAARVVNFCPVLLQKLHSARQRVKALQALEDQSSKSGISVAEARKKMLGFAEEVQLAINVRPVN